MPAPLWRVLWVDGSHAGWGLYRGNSSIAYRVFEPNTYPKAQVQLIADILNIVQTEIV